jgi:hypothetical protein
MEIGIIFKRCCAACEESSRISLAGGFFFCGHGLSPRFLDQGKNVLHPPSRAPF